ncbi:RNA polymerase sigma factor [Fulvivirga sedimenti]|uniref:Sigma-70 family RNA polymerase sigma factor n=1 Tax=Fulvivirga sedimenti TaxID=2879465 RepID=A0A9X1HS16_9BACT|nr:sigma-70 family RNA polymerase sigma factor [Fulvivirga sedimenti]MCA6074555.1 sigma-70 family RNA polymerase sigma factor [Fulvivirga sedimenti]MCA6075732.1 sigma-70 family RNA polymerase sigma factor [Fulvivirga sedimenti]MCA6076860.1 sigma-70 family RNA polymerase sigma factor [Fulvivirga sedimenti]
MDKPDNDIVNLIKGCRDNDRAMQKKLYQRYYSFAMSICMRYGENREDAVEIMNDGFFKAFKYIRSFELDQPFEPWLKRVMVNCSIDHFKRKSRMLFEDDTYHTETIAGQSTILESITYEEMLSLVKKLPDAYRTVFNLVAIEGYKHEEVSKLLNISTGTSKSNYSRARAKLQIMLKEYFGVRNG